VFVAGNLLTFVPGAPSFVNATFAAQFPDGLPAGSLVFVVK